tara:strand:- start:38 stop:274 length:237 start_codon:yes stop_codon:yes gene_type:complete
MTTISDPDEYMNLEQTKLWCLTKFPTWLDAYTEMALEHLWEEYIQDAQLANETGDTYDISDYGAIDNDETPSTGVWIE